MNKNNKHFFEFLQQFAQNLGNCIKDLIINKSLRFNNYKNIKVELHVITYTRMRKNNDETHLLAASL